MITLEVRNHTTRKKAVRIPGGHYVLEPGAKVILDLDNTAISEAEGERMIAAGLTFDPVPDGTKAVNRAETPENIAATAPTKATPPKPPAKAAEGAQGAAQGAAQEVAKAPTIKEA